jgi:hypothetical protein
MCPDDHNDRRFQKLLFDHVLIVWRSFRYIVRSEHGEPASKEAFPDRLNTRCIVGPERDEDVGHFRSFN